MNVGVMGDSRLTKKERKNKMRSARKRLCLKNQNFKPVLKSVDIEEIKKKFKLLVAKKTNESSGIAMK